MFYSKMKIIFSLFVFMVYFLGQSLSVKLGESCNLLNPSLWCDQGGNMGCTLTDGSYKCVCNSGNTPNADHTFCAGTYDELCYLSTPNECNTDRGLRCYSAGVVLPYGYCGCADRTGHVFSEISESCVALSGSSCDPMGSDHGCTEHSTCDATTSTCTCDDGFFSNGDRKCQLENGDIGTTCESDNDCDYDILHLECNSQNICQCAESKEYHENSNSTCLRNYGSRCSSLDPCDDEFFQTCSSFSAQSGVCKCKSAEAQIFDPESKKCIAIAGTRCGEDDPYYPGINCIANAECVEGVCNCSMGFLPTHDHHVCRVKTAHELGDNCDPLAFPEECSQDSFSVCTLGVEDESYTCQCPPDKYHNKNFTRCYANYGEYCNESEGLYCNDDRHLGCTFSRCRCQSSSDHVWDASRDSCVGLVGGWCNPGDSVWDILCTDNSYCQILEHATICTCDDGFEQTADKRCVQIE